MNRTLFTRLMGVKRFDLWDWFLILCTVWNVVCFFINITILCSNEEHIASRVQIAC